MATTDFGYGTTQTASDAATRSLDIKQRRNSYHVRASAAAAGMHGRMYRMAISVATMLAGAYLTLNSGAIAQPDGWGAMLIFPIGLYLIIAGAYWLISLLRRPQELIMDKANRVFHLVRPALSGAERSRKTIRFEEVANISIKDHLRGFDMAAHAMNWSLARIDITWQGDQICPTIVGDIAELEPLLAKLRREVGMA